MRTSTTLSFSRVSRYRLERDLSSLKISSPSSEISQKIVTTLNEISRERYRLEQDVSFFQISSPSNELYQERYCLERDLSKRYSPESILKRVSMSLERCHYRFKRDPRQRCHHLLEQDISWELFVSRETSHFGRYHLPRSRYLKRTTSIKIETSPSARCLILFSDVSCLERYHSREISSFSREYY